MTFKARQETERLEAELVQLRRRLGSFVVNVQVSVTTTAPRPQVLIYNVTRSVVWEGDADDEVLELMAGRKKAHFRAHVRDDGKIILDKEERASW